jgi:hypothetical protein
VSMQKLNKSVDKAKFPRHTKWYTSRTVFQLTA